MRTSAWGGAKPHMDNSGQGAGRYSLRTSILDDPFNMGVIHLWRPQENRDFGPLPRPNAVKTAIVQWPNVEIYLKLYSWQLNINVYRPYWRNISAFYSSKKNANFLAWEEDRMTSVGSNFLCGRPRGAYPILPSADVHLSLTPFLPPCGRQKWMTPMGKSISNSSKILGSQLANRPTNNSSKRRNLPRNSAK